MSKHSEKKVIEVHHQPYYQTYVPTPYIPTTYEQPIVIQQMVPTQIITTEPTVIREKRVVQAESQFIKQDILQQPCNTACTPCIQSCVPCCDKEKVVTRQVVLKEKQQPNNQEYERKLNEIEKLHIQEIKEMELRMQQQLDQLQNQKIQDDQQKQLVDLKTSIQDLKLQILNQKQQQQQQQQPQQQQQQPQQQFFSTLQIEKLENQIQKKKSKIKDLKNHVNGLQQELQTRTFQIQELEVRLRQPQPQPQQIVHVPQENYELLNQVRYLEQERGGLLREIEQLRVNNSELSLLSFRQDPEKARLQQDFSRMMNDFRLLEQENIKMATIIGQKDELIKSLEQRISVELSRQSILMQQSSPQRVVLEQTTRPVQYVIDQQPVHKQYIIQDTVQPTLVQQTLPNVKILQ